MKSIKKALLFLEHGQFFIEIYTLVNVMFW